jgi:3(or 17)beta-hydroxysteroid dehydrogenase
MEGKVVVVTGAAKGLGEADARLLAEEGATVILTDVDEAAGARVAAEIGGQARFARHDVTRESDWEALMTSVLENYGRLDGLVNNAGVVEAATPETTTEAQYRRVMAVSADGTFFGCKHSIRAIRQTGAGSIVNMASAASIRGHWRYAAYCAAKGAVESLTRAVAVYCAQNGLKIRCNSLHPSGFDTPMVRDILPKAQALTAPGASAPVRELGDAIEVAKAVLFLLSDESRYINGVALSVDNAITVA